MKMSPADILEYPIPKVGNFTFLFLGKTLDEIQKKAGISWRVRIVAPHIPHVLYAFVYEIVKVHSQAPAYILDKINSGLISPKST